MIRKILEFVLLLLALLLCALVFLLVLALACPKPGGPHPVPSATAQTDAHDLVEEPQHGGR